MCRFCCWPFSKCCGKSKCCKKRKDKEEPQNEKSSAQHSDTKIWKSESKAKTQKGSSKEMLPLTCSHDENIKGYPEGKWKDRKGSQNKMLLSKRKDDEDIKEYPERLKRDLEDSENEKAALKINHREEMGVLNNELRDVKESLRSAEAKINQLTRQLEDEWKANEKAVLRKSEEYMNEKSTLEQNHQEEIKNLKEEIQRLKERTKEQEQLQHKATSTEQKEKDLVKEEYKKKLDESENEKVALKISHKEEIGALNEQIQKLQDRLTTDKSSYEKKEKELKTKCDELEIDVARLTTDKSSYEKIEKELKKKCDELEIVVARLTIDKSSYEKREKELERTCDELKADIASYKENWTKSEDAKIQLEIKITELKNKSEEREREIKMWTNRHNSLEEEKKKTEGELKRIQVMYNQLRIQHENEKKDKEDALLRLGAKNNELTNQLDKERKAKEDALLRLSSMASNKLRDNNPNIADLSDPNRPTKLSEQFSELYDNEWTDAFDELEKLLGEKEEKEIISYLRDFVLEIYSICSEITSSKLKTIEEAFAKPSVPSEDTKIPTEIFKSIKDGIKSMAPKFLEHTRERVLGHLEEKYLGQPVAGCLQHQNVKRYIDKCTEVCWYMSVQDPQLVMDGSKSPDEKFDSNKHREYTKKGPYEEFVVWPVLYLYRGGQMLSKGVAQGGKKEMIGQQ